jgi:tRNA-splicing ligase RtcB (3'-phosphate/5'-hydroxy nucleic acid ligase)
MNANTHKPRQRRSARRRSGLSLSDCYKRLPAVLAAHGDTIRVLHTLTPLGVAMAGANEFDPYKD